MSKINGKQIKSTSIELGKLDGSGVVSFETGAEMTFLTGSTLYYTDSPTNGFEVTNKTYVDDLFDSALSSSAYNAGDGLLLTGLTFSINPTTAGSGLSYTTGVYDINVDSTSLEINGSDEVSLKSTISGNRTFSNDLIVSGNLTVNGTTTFVNTTELEITDNIITLAKGNTSGSGVDAGIEVDRGTDPTPRLIWDESSDTWAAGIQASELSILTDVGSGLTRTNNVVSLDSTSVVSNAAGQGLVANGSTLDVGSGDGITVDSTSVSIASSAAGNGLSLTAGVFDVGVGAGITVDATSVAVNPGDGITTNVNGVSLDASSAGAGLGFATGVYSVNTGLGLEIATDDVQIQLGATPGLEFISNGLSVKIDNSTLILNGNGEIEVDKDFLKAEPIYDTTTLATSYTSNDSVTNLAFSAAPSKFSRVEVYVNGLKQKISSGTAALDGYFVNPGTPATAKSFDNLALGDVLVWNATNAGFSLESGDEVEIVYEA